MAVADAEASTSELAVGRIALANAGRIVARPAEATRAIDTNPAAVTTKHGDPPRSRNRIRPQPSSVPFGTVAAIMGLGRPPDTALLWPGPVIGEVMMSSILLFSNGVKCEKPGTLAVERFSQ